MDSLKSEIKNPTGSETKSDESATLSDALAAAYDAQIAATAAPTEDSIAEDVSASADDADTKASSEDDVAPPEHWSDEDKTAFLAMDKAGRDWALRAEANYHKGIQAKSEELKKLRGPIEEYRHLFQGVDEGEGVRRLLAAQAFLQQNPTEGLRWLMRNLGVDEKQFAQPQQTAPEDDPFVDPEVKKLKDEVRVLRETAEKDLRNAQTRQYQAMVAEIQKFQGETDEQGQPKHPYAQQVFPTMAGLLQSGRATDLESAYQQAVWALPEYRDSVVQQQVEQRAQEEIAKRVKAAEEAKKKATTVNGKSSAKQSPKDLSLTDALSAAYDKSVRGEL